METIDGEKPERISVLRRMLRLIAFASILLLALALLGYIVRDRTWWLALLMYLPLTIVAPMTIAAQIVAFERRGRMWRLIVIFIATVACLVALRGMVQAGYVGGQAGAAHRAVERAMGTRRAGMAGDDSQDRRDEAGRHRPERSAIRQEARGLAGPTWRSVAVQRGAQQAGQPILVRRRGDVALADVAGVGDYVAERRGLRGDDRAA
jgi:hypothetical protein